MDDKRIHGKKQTSKQCSSLFVDMSVVEHENVPIHIEITCLGVDLSFNILTHKLSLCWDFEDPLYKLKPFTLCKPKFNFDF